MRKPYHHARFSPEAIAKGVQFVSSFEPTSQVEKRNKLILEKFFIEGLTYTAIARLQDPLIVAFGNRSKNKPLSATSIARIVTDYFPSLKNVPAKHKKADYEARNELKCRRRVKASKHIHQCAFCGSGEHLEEHHMIPLSMGGTNDERNLVFLCNDCHKLVSEYQMELQACDKRNENEKEIEEQKS